MDAAVALQRKKTIKFLCIVDFLLSKQGIFFITLTHKTCKFCDNSWKCRSFSFLKNSLCCDAMLVSARKLARSPHGAYLPQRQKSDQGRINPIFSLALLLEDRYNILWIKGSKGRILVEKRVRCAAATPPAEMPDAVPDA